MKNNVEGFQPASKYKQVHNKEFGMWQPSDICQTSAGSALQVGLTAHSIV